MHIGYSNSNSETTFTGQIDGQAPPPPPSPPPKKKNKQTNEQNVILIILNENKSRNLFSPAKVKQSLHVSQIAPHAKKAMGEQCLSCVSYFFCFN